MQSKAGCLLLMGGRYLSTTKPLVAEAEAMREGLRQALKRKLEDVELETNSKQLVGAILGNEVPWSIKPIIHDFQHLRAKFLFCSVVSVSRKANMCAGAIAS